MILLCEVYVLSEFNLSKARYYIEGEGQPVYLIGGQFVDIDGWGPTIEDLKRFYKVIVLEYPNQGKSETDLSFVNLRQYAEYSIDFLKAINVKPEDTIVFGLSFGANVIKSMTFDFNIKFKAAILSAVSSTYRLKNYISNNYRLWISIIKGLDIETAFKVIFLKLMSPDYIEDNDGIVDFASKLMAENFKDKKEALICLLEASINYLKEVDGENDLSFPYDMYLIGAKSDTMMPFNYVEDYARLTHAKLYQLPGGHLINMEHPFELLSVIHEILDEYDEE